VSFISKFVADFKQGRAEAAAEHGVAERKAADRDRRRRNFEDPAKRLEEDKKLLEAVAIELEEKDGKIAELEAERDKLAVERDQVQAELANNKEILAGLAEQAEQLKAERDQLAEVLKGPGVRKLLLNTYHSDKAAKLSKAERAALDDFTAKLNAAYDLIEKIDKAAAADAAAKAGEEAEGEE
jgi:hypothetical protein